LTSIIDVSWNEQQSAEGAQVSRGAFVPEHGMKAVYAIARLADDLAVVIDGLDGPVRVTADSWEFLLNLALFPDDRPKLESYGG
jgi:hypothetical protein